ncbi:hypothetical protein BN1184_BB_00120 [Pantoea ananatis]|nr:hypothetical protein BN1184_BB_00120 [Pantoea ananatis]
MVVCQQGDGKIRPTVFDSSDNAELKTKKGGVAARGGIHCLKMY